MKAMILAAGKGTRMGALGQHCPKLLLPVAGHPLVHYHLQQLKQANILDIVINVSHCADRIKQQLGDGQDYGVKLTYSEESTALETGGGIFQALPLLGQQPFLVISGDIFTTFPYQQLPQQLSGLAHLVLNDPFCDNLRGDFTLNGSRVANHGLNKLNFANIGIYHPALFQHCQAGCFKLAPLLRQAATQGLVTGEYFSGTWFNIGNANTYHRLQKAML